MNPYEFPNFETAIEQLKYRLVYRSKFAHSARWQGIEIANKPEMATHEITHVSFMVPLRDEDSAGYAAQIQPNMPWAEDHFLERVCGAPINPGVEWANWPYGKSAASFLDERGKFNHNYMERYWPKNARSSDPATLRKDDWVRYNQDTWGNDTGTFNHGIRYQYGDLADVVSLLATDPYTRQAYLPIFFPEDTGGGNKRAPCTIGYHFLMREGFLDINYHIRSCDFVRHFRDDCYLTVRLLLWMLERCRAINPEWWTDVRPGKFVMQIGSLHVFANDYQILRG